MATATEKSVRGEPVVGVPLVEDLQKRADIPEWQSLRLFGGGRHPGTFDAGAETRAELW